MRSAAGRPALALARFSFTASSAASLALGVAGFLAPSVAHADIQHVVGARPYDRSDRQPLPCERQGHRRGRTTSRTSSTLHPGDVLVIPTKDSPAGSGTKAKSDTKASTAPPRSRKRKRGKTAKRGRTARRQGRQGQGQEGFRRQPRQGRTGSRDHELCDEGRRPPRRHPREAPRHERGVRHPRVGPQRARSGPRRSRPSRR